MTLDVLDHDDVAAAGLADWRFVHHALMTRFDTRRFAVGLDLVRLIGEAAEEADHHPDLDLRYGHLNVRLFSHDAFGVTRRDLALAHRISALAASLGVVARPTEVAMFELALDTPDPASIAPFWEALYATHDATTDHEVRDGRGELPTLWFQTSGADEPRMRFHVDLYVPLDQVRTRVDAVVAAGGRVVTETDRWVVLEDAEGNKACVCW
ncbi:MAG: 4a-hydroxytetrahydrobiopterin dehydratase [Acidimicrobiales bacterium]